jgi:hypothetical protein
LAFATKNLFRRQQKVLDKRWGEAIKELLSGFATKSVLYTLQKIDF